MSGFGLTPDLQAMGIGAAEPDAELQQQAAPANKDEAFLAELNAMVNGNDAPAVIEQVEAASPFTADGVRQPPTQPSAPPDNTTVPEVDLSGETQTVDGLPFNLAGYVEPDTNTGDDGQNGVDQGQGNANGPVPDGSIDLNQLAERIYGAKPDEATATQILQMAKDMQNLTPVQAAQINSILNGQGAYQPQYPQPQYQPQYPPQPQPQFEQQPYTPPGYQQPVRQTPDLTQFQIPDTVDPDIAASLAPVAEIVRAQQAQIDQMNQRIYQESQQRRQQEIQRDVTVAEAAEKQWREEKQQAQRITNEEWLGLQQDAINSGLLGWYAQQTQDPAQAMRLTLDHVYNQNPVFMEREVHARAQQAQLDAAKQHQRTSKASALAGGGGAVKPTTPQQQRPNNNGGVNVARRSSMNETPGAMLDEIQQLLTGTQS